jgi:hypothetical protein
VGAGDGAGVVTADAWVGVVAVVLSLGLFLLERRLERRHTRSSDAIQAAQQQSISRLLAIEERRAVREAEDEERAAEVAAEAVRQGLVAGMTVVVLAWAVNTPRYVQVVNEGPHEAELISALIRNGELDTGPVATHEWTELAGKVLAPGEGVEVKLLAIGPGRAWVDLRWRDGREGVQSATVELEIPEQHPFHGGAFNRDMPSWLRRR